MKNLLKRSFCLVLVLSLLFAFSAVVSASDESDYVAAFTITTNKQTVQKGDTVTVSVNLKTNYPIYAMQIPVIYDATVFEVQNTSSTNLKSFLSFKECLSNYYAVNGSWKSTEVMYSRNSNPSYWSSSDIQNRYKIAYATWVADSSISPTLVTLNQTQTIVTFNLKVKSNFSDVVSSRIFMNSDWIKTASSPAGMLAVGRSTGDTVDVTPGGHVDVGQTIDLTKAASTVSINGDDDVQITSDNTIVTDIISMKVPFFSLYKNNPIKLGVLSNQNAVSFVWSSDSSRIAVDQTGKVTNTFWLASSGNVTVKAYNQSGELVGSDTVSVRFYKFWFI